MFKPLCTCEHTSREYPETTCAVKAHIEKYNIYVFPQLLECGPLYTQLEKILIHLPLFTVNTFYDIHQQLINN